MTLQLILMFIALFFFIIANLINDRNRKNQGKKPLKGWKIHLGILLLAAAAFKLFDIWDHNNYRWLDKTIYTSVSMNLKITIGLFFVGRAIDYFLHEE